MKRTLFFKRPPVCFKRFSRKGYSLFSVLGREVVIGVLSVPTLCYAKADGVSTDLSLVRDSLRRDELRLDEVVVTGTRVPLTALQSARIVTVVSREEIDRAAATTINDVLKLATGVDVRQRGGYGVQTDVSVRGGNFDQITILLNGVNISSPHTGHHSPDFPVLPDDIERIEVLEGGFESGLCGVINVITKSAGESVVNVQGGSYGFVGGNGRLSLRRGRSSASVSGGYVRSDGATPNSAFSSSRLFGRFASRLAGVDLSAQLGYSYKPYEANTFYGAASTDQHESLERIIASVSARKDFAGRGAIEASGYWNRWYDHYEWHHHDPVGENFHSVDAGGVALSGWVDNALGKSSFSAELRSEAIWSSVLGRLQPEEKWRPTSGHDARPDAAYRYHDARQILRLSLEHNVVLRSTTISPSVTYFHSRQASRFLPALNIAHRFGPTTKLFASWSLALRLPTFIDLYYSGANIEGNDRLKPENTSDLQLGLRHSGVGYSLEAQVFYSHKFDMIDWVTTLSPSSDGTEQSDGIFRSVNFRMNTVGCEANLSLLPRELAGAQFPIAKLSARYAYLSQDSRYPVAVVQSKYAMEYLRHKLVLSADGRLWRQLGFSVSWRWQNRLGQAMRSYALLDGRLQWDAGRWLLYLDATNLLDKEYYDYVSIRQPGRQLIGGLKLRF